MLRGVGLILLIGGVTILWGSPVRSQMAVSRAIDQPRKLELLRSSEQGFDGSIDAFFPGLRQLDGFEPIKPLLVMLHNSSGHGIKAYVVRWVMARAKDSTRQREGIYWAGTGGSEALTGEEIVWKPDESRLVSPLFNWGVSPTVSQRMDKLLSALAKGPIVTDAADALNIEISIDAVVFDDGVFLGPDKGGFYDRYECERNGAQDEGKFVLSLLNANTSGDQIVAGLKANIETGQNQDGIDRNSLLGAARGREAQRLLRVFNESGRGALESLSRRLVGYAPTVLRRQ
jgi:hypothetical protein